MAQLPGEDERLSLGLLSGLLARSTGLGCSRVRDFHNRRLPGVLGVLACVSLRQPLGPRIEKHDEATIRLCGSDRVPARGWLGRLALT